MTDTGAPTSASDARRPGFADRLRARLAGRSADDAHAEDLRSDAERAGATPIAAVQPGERVTVCGTVRSLTLRPRAGTPALEAELYDGSGVIRLVWLGRRRIQGIDPGRGIVAHGRATQGRDSLVVYNAGYELRPSGSE